MATYLYFLAHFAFLSHTQGSALEGEKPMSNMMSWIFWDHLRPELLSPYSALYITNISPSSSSKSGPAIMLTENVPKTLSKAPCLVAKRMSLTLHLLLFKQSM